MEEVLILKSETSSNGSPQDSGLQESLALPPSMCVIAAAAPPLLPPPPPPPPLPPPPPPPPPLNPSFSSRNAHRKSMKKLNWDTLPSQRVLGTLNVWTSNRPQRDLVLDIRSMEELFSHIDKRASLRNPGIMGVRKSAGMELLLQEPQVTILDSKKSMNVGIFLRHFKRPVTEMVQDIHQGNWLRFGAGKLKELCKLLPEKNEVKQLLSFTGNLSALPEADQFMVQLVKVPGYVERLKMMLLREEFFPLVEEVKNSVSVMTKAANELLDCDDLHSVIRLVLKAGNYMNAGGYSANAIGFRMSSLLNLADTKANKPGMNLMHYVAKQAEDIDAELLTFHSQLENIGMASRVCKDEVVADFDREVKKMKEVKLYSSRHPDLLQQMESFLMRANAKVADVESSLHQLNSLSDAVAEYFCEDPTTFKLEECCSIFHSFCKRFDKAVQENREREEAEKRRKRKESMRFAAKRRSTMCSSEPEPVQDSSGLESALHSFLSTVPQGLSRCRRNILPPIEGSPSSQDSQTPSSAEKKETSTKRDSPEVKSPKMLKEIEREEGSENQEEAEKMREVTRKVLKYQNSKSSLDEETLPGTPCQLPVVQNTPSTPCTPRPRTRDFFFANNGDLGSPWTILSPFTSDQRIMRPAHRRRGSLPSGEEDDAVWQTVEAGTKPPSGSSGSVPESTHHRPVSQGPVVRSVSVDESRLSPLARFRLGELFQRSYSSGSKTETVEGEEVSLLRSKARSQVEGPGSGSGLVSFFRRIGGKNKPSDVEEQPLTGCKT